jgi:AraC-like DNA-binding protein
MKQHYQLQQHVPTEKMPLGIVHIQMGQSDRKVFHDHNHSEIVVVPRGTGIHLMNGKEAEIKTGDLLVVHPGFVHAYDRVETLEVINLIYDAQRLYLPVLDAGQLPLFNTFFPVNARAARCTAEPLLTLSPPDLAKVMGIIGRMKRELSSNQRGCCFYSLALLMEIIVLIGRLREDEEEKEPIPFRIGDSLKYIKTHFQHTVSVEQLAKDAGMSRRSFFQQFKNVTGCSPIQYLIRLRISRAADMLRQSGLRINEIAYQCGFPDSNYFCKTFHRQTGMSPRQFRQKNRCGS